MHNVYRDLRALFDSYQPPRVIIGEIAVPDWEGWAAYFGSNLDEMHLPFNFSLLYTPWEAGEVRSRVEAVERVLPDGAWPNYVLGNHDEPRLATRFGASQARLAAMLLLTLRGTPTLYQGDELGIEQVEIPADRQQDPWAILEPDLGRDGGRTPMQWDPTETAGFSEADPADLWLPLTSDRRSANVETQSADPTSILTLYRRLLALRRRCAALHRGAYRTIDAIPAEVFAFVRSLDGERVAVVLNFSSSEVRFKHDLVDGSEPLLSTRLQEPDIDGAVLTLHAAEGVVLAL